jgi:hypothetical protein
MVDSYDIATQFNRHEVAAARISRRRLEKSKLSR